MNWHLGWIKDSVRNKLLVAFVGLGILPLVLLGVFVEWTAGAALRDRAVAQLTTTSTLQRERVAALFDEYGLLAEFIATNPDIQERITAITRGQGDKAALAAEVDSRLKPVIKNLPEILSAQIMDTTGTVLADTIPGAGTQKGKSKSTDQYFTGAMATPGKVHVKPIYVSSTSNVPTSAISLTMNDPAGKLIGVVTIRINTSRLERILEERTGQGETGESYLVIDKLIVSDKVDPNRKMLMATPSRFVKESALKTVVETKGSRAAVSRETGWATYPNYRNESVMGYYTWLPEINAALLSEVETTEALQAVGKLRWTIISIVVAVALLALLVSLLLSGALTKQVHRIMEVFSSIGMGNFAARAVVTSSDELGTMALSLNAMLDNTMSLMQSQDERDKIQESIAKLLEEVSGVAEGDLTKDAEVTTDVTGTIADSFNYMIEQLRKIIGNVQTATLQVSSSANEIHATAEHLAQGTEAQAEQIVNTSAAIDEMAVSIQQVSENANVSATVAQQASSNAKQGSLAVQNTIQGMNRIRDQVQETAKRIKRLGESSQEIGQIIQLIDDIADRTSILALNASIQAAMAGDAGRGFAVVAEEVERLAVRSTDATKKIATLIKTIQSETNEAVSAMEKGINEVVDGSKLANQAGQTLVEIETVSNKLAELIQSISLASKQQARGSEALAKAMSEISQITQQTAAGTKQAAVSVNDLASLADDLRASVSTFRLPGSNGNGHGNGKNDHGPAEGIGPGKAKDGNRLKGLAPKLSRT